MQLIGVQNIGSTFGNPNVNVCGGLASAVANLLIGTFEDQLLATAADGIEALEAQVVSTAADGLSGETVLACEPAP